MRNSININEGVQSACGMVPPEISFGRLIEDIHNQQIVLMEKIVDLKNRMYGDVTDDDKTAFSNIQQSPEGYMMRLEQIVRTNNDIMNMLYDVMVNF